MKLARAAGRSNPGGVQRYGPTTNRSIHSDIVFFRTFIALVLFGIAFAGVSRYAEEKHGKPAPGLAHAPLPYSPEAAPAHPLDRGS